MKKSVRFIAFAVIAGSLFFMTACGEDPHQHSYASAWSTSATAHWHAATCEHTDEKKDLDGHVDENKDGACDVCLYDGGHIHTFKNTYSYDENNHWYDSDCYHAVKDGVAAHQANSLGYCVCGYKVGDPDVSTIAKAVALGVQQESLVNGGTVNKTTDNGEAAPYTEYGSFDIGEDYFHQLNYYYISGWTFEEYWFGKVNGAVVPFERQGQDIVFYNYEIENEAVNGWFFDGNENANVTGKCYGVADYIESLYEAATVSAMDNTLSESVADGVYTFSFDVYHSDSSDDISTISVEFTLGSTYFIETANVSVERWYYAVDSNEDGVFEKPAGACDYKTQYEITQRTGDAVIKMFDPAEKVVSSFDVYDGDELMGDTIYITAGTAKSFDVKNFAPESAAGLEYDNFGAMGINVDTEEDIGLSTFWGDYVTSFIKSTKKLTFNFKFPGTYTVTYGFLACKKTVTVVVDYAEVTSINATVNGVNATTGSCFVNDKFAFGTAVNAYAENLATAEFTSVPEGSALTSSDLLLNSSTGMWMFSPDVVGQYVIKVTAANAEGVSATLTVTVNEKPSVGPLFNGTWAAQTGFINTKVEAVFTPDATPVDGAEFSGSVVVSSSGGMMETSGGSYRYVYANGAFKLYEADGTTAVAGTKWWVKLNADMTMHAVYNGNDWGSLVQQASSGGDAPAGENTLAGTTWSATTNFLAAVVTAEFGEDTVVVSAECAMTDMDGGTYAYTYDGTNFTIDGATGAKWWVEVYPDGLVHAIYNGQDKGALAKQEGTTGGDDEGDEPVGPTFEGTGAESDPYVITEVPVDFTVNYEVGGYVYYQYVPEEDGALTIAADSNDYWVIVINGTKQVANNEGNPAPTVVNMEAGKTYLIRLSTFNENISTQFGISLTWGETVVVVEPIVLQDGANVINVTDEDIANEVIPATYYCGTDATYTFASEDGIVAIVYDEYGMQYGRGQVYLTSWQNWSINLYVGGLTEAGEYTLTITYEEPLYLYEGDNEVEVTEDDITAQAMEFTFNSVDAGEYVFSASDEAIQFQILQDGILISRFPTVTLEAYATYTVSVYVANVTAGTYTITATYNAPEGSYDNPVAIETLPAELTVPVADPGYSLYYYTLTVEEATTIVITFADNNSYATVESAEESLLYGYEQTSYEVALPAAGTYKIALGSWDKSIFVESVSVTIAVAEEEVGGGEEEGGDESGALTGVKTWIGANGSGRRMQVTIDYDNKTITVIRAHLGSGSLDVSAGANEATYSYDGANGDYTFTQTGSQALTIELDANGAPVSIVWGTATYTGWELQA